MRYAELKPGLPASVFPPSLVSQMEEHSTQSEAEDARQGVNSLRRRNRIEFQTAAQLPDRDDEFEDEDLDDVEFRKAGKSVKSLCISPAKLYLTISG